MAAFDKFDSRLALTDTAVAVDENALPQISTRTPWRVTRGASELFR